jgi:hypothetical protein
VADLFQTRQGVARQRPLPRPPAGRPEARQDEASRQRQPDADQYQYAVIGHAAMMP